MRDPIDDDDIDRAYRVAVETTTDVALGRRRRGAVLKAVEGLDAIHEAPVDRQSAAPGSRTAANEAHRYPSATWWRGVAAACVIGTSTLVVMQMQRAPDATVETRLRSDADRQERSTSRTEQPSAPSKETLGAVAVPPPSPAAAEAGDAVAKNAPRMGPAARAGKAAVNTPSESLLVAVNRGDIEAARTALQTIDPDAERDADGRTALAIAVLRADLPLVKLLLESGANRRAEDRYGQTPVSYANASGDTTMLHALERP